MIKVSAARSAMRRMVLTKVADEYSDLMNGYANAHRPGIVGAGVRTAVNANLRASGCNPAPAAEKAPAAPAKAPSPGFWDGYKARGGTFNPFKDAYNQARTAGRDLRAGLGAVGRFVSGKGKPMLGSAATPQVTAR